MMTIASLSTLVTLASSAALLPTTASAIDTSALDNIQRAIKGIVPLSDDWPSASWANGASNSPSATSTKNSTSTSTGWTLKPTAGATWNIQLISLPPASAADNDAYKIWDFDMADANSELIEAFHAKNRSVICYFSAGSWENFRSDASEFPEDAIGKVMDGWPEEKWVDTRNEGVRDLMRKRILQAKEKGCDGVDPDNIDGYNNDSGFDLTSKDAVDFVRFLAKTAHDAGLSYGLKNGGDIVDQVVDVSEWCVQEECVHYKECEQYLPFIEANKPVFHLEYTDETEAGEVDKFVQTSCNGEDSMSFSTLVKHLNLDDWTRSCP